VADHYYLKDGTPFYEVLGKNGKIRSVNVRDAREHNAVPSVTTILNLAAKPGLINWMIDQAILAALTMPKNPDESEEEYLKRIKHDSKQQGRDAADEGTRIHDAVENYMKGNKIDPAYSKYATSVSEKLQEMFGEQKWNHEKSFAHEYGFGGKVDLFSDNIVADIKTKEFGENDKVQGYDEHAMQLAAYRYGLGLHDARCVNIFVSRNNPGLVHVHEWTEKELVKSWSMFCIYLDLWKLKNGGNK
jgi:hypothetical protein